MAFESTGVVLEVTGMVFEATGIDIEHTSVAFEPAGADFSHLHALVSSPRALAHRRCLRVHKRCPRVRPHAFFFERRGAVLEPTGADQPKLISGAQQPSTRVPQGVADAGVGIGVGQEGFL